MIDYNYDGFLIDDYDFDILYGVFLGGKVLDFEFDIVLGLKCCLFDFEGDFLIFEMGSIICFLF